MSAAVASVGRARSVTLEGVRSPAQTNGAASLLPSPVMQDPMLALYALTAKQRDADTNAKKSAIEDVKQRRQEAFEKLEQALAEAKKAREESSFWDDLFSVFTGIAKVVAAVAAVASAIATGGASLAGVLAIGSAVSSGLAMANKELGIIKGPIGEALNTVLSVAGMAAGGVAAGASLFASSAKAAEAAGDTARVAGYVAKGAKLGAAASSVGAGAAKIVAEDYKHDAALYDIEAERAAQQQRKNQRDEQRLIDDVRQLYAHYQRSLDTLVGAIGDQQRTRETLAGTIRG
jgi:hypothetical protein